MSAGRAGGEGPAGHGAGGGEGGGRASEERLEALRREAARSGHVDAPGVLAEGGPVPGTAPPAPGSGPGRVAPGAAQGAAAGYHGRPLLKPPVWTWEVPVYLFVGGAAGMAAPLALGAAALGAAGPARAAAWVAAGGALLAPLLLVLDLGRPARFLNMLRVFKLRSPMSVGAWTLAGFGALAVPAALLLEAVLRGLVPVDATSLLGLGLLLAGSALLGALLATYTGVLLAVTAVPAWAAHRVLLPVHFGVAGLGSAAALVELLAGGAPALHVLGLAAAGLETLLGAAFELARHGAADRALRTGRPALLLRSAGLLAGPGALALRLTGLGPAAAWAFLAGALLSRFGWMAAGRASALDPEAALAAAGGGAGREPPVRPTR